MMPPQGDTVVALGLDDATLATPKPAPIGSPAGPLPALREKGAV